MEKQYSQLEHGQPRCGSLSITTPVSFLTNEFDVRSVLHQANELGICQSNFV